MRFINSVDFGSDFEAHLNFLVSARSAFANLDLVQEVLVYRAIALIVGVYDRVGRAASTPAARPNPSSTRARRTVKLPFRACAASTSDFVCSRSPLAPPSRTGWFNKSTV